MEGSLNYKSSVEVSAGWSHKAEGGTSHVHM